MIIIMEYIFHNYTNFETEYWHLFRNFNINTKQIKAYLESVNIYSFN